MQQGPYLKKTHHHSGTMALLGLSSYRLLIMLQTLAWWIVCQCIQRQHDVLVIAAHMTRHKGDKLQVKAIVYVA